MGACIALPKNYEAASQKQQPSPPRQRDSATGGRGKHRNVVEKNESEALNALLNNMNLGSLSSSQRSHLINIMKEISQSKYAALFSAHPELYFSNRAAVMCTGEFRPGEVVEKYTVVRAMPTGTVGRGFVVTSLQENKTNPFHKGGISNSNFGEINLGGPHNALRRSRHVELGSVLQPTQFVFKVVTFLTRMDQIQRVMDDHKVLFNLMHSNLVNCTDVLDDENRENLIIVTPYIEKGNCVHLAGEVETEEKLISLLYDVARGLRVLHSHQIYHHNLKLDNILLRSNGTACIADAGFYHIFASQSPESLVFNGELACMPPELLEENRSSIIDACKVDIWGFGLLMYHLIYGKEMWDVEGKPFGDVRQLILQGEKKFPNTKWSCKNKLEEVITRCLDKDPEKRPNIMQLLHHPLFGKQGIQQMTIMGGDVGRNNNNNNNINNNNYIMMRNSDVFRNSSMLYSSSVSCSIVRGLYSRQQRRGGLSVSVSLGSGLYCETFVVSASKNTPKESILKVFNRSIVKLMEETGNVDNILHELAFCRYVQYPHILPLLEIVDNKEGCFAKEAFVESYFLSERFPPLHDNEDPSCTVKRLLVDVLKGLHVMHINGVSHLSLRPSNVYYQRGTGFVLTDYGPLFVCEEELLSPEKTSFPLDLLPSWVIEDLKEPPATRKYALDTFCVGLLAASALPSVNSEVWSILTGRTSRANVYSIVESVLRRVVENVDILTSPLVEFISKALTEKTNAKELLMHYYLVDLVDISELLSMKPMELSSVKDKKNIIFNNFNFWEESRLLDVLGRDPTLESAMFGNSALMRNSIINGHDNKRGNFSFVGDADLSVRFPFEKNIICGLCRVKLHIVLFLCPLCEVYIRCGKCALNDDHKEGHTLDPYIVYMIEHIEKDKKEAVLLPPTAIKKDHALEELEMEANLPMGSLTKLNKAKIPSALGSLSCLHISNNDDDCNEVNSSDWSANSVNDDDDNNINNNSCTNTFGNSATNKKKALPKAFEMEDLLVEEEIANCRLNISPELLLYRCDLTNVPKEIFDPPLLHLVSLDLSYNRLKSIPHELSFLCNLHVLVIAQNELSELPESLGDLGQLERLDVSHNNLQTLPDSFVYLGNLSTLSMDYNEFMDLPAFITEMVRSYSLMPILLSAIYLAGNPRIRSFPKVEVLEKIPKLKLALDNEPNVYGMYITEKFEEKLPNVSMMWNKIYPDRIVDYVYCGSLRSAQSQLVYQTLSISRLLTVGRELVPTPPIGGDHLTVSVDDIEGANIRLTFEESVEFIDESVKSKRGCLVHCFAGMSRSATTVIAYLMIKQGMRLDEAYCTTKRGRPAIYPNQGFFNQLIMLDKELFPGQRPLDMTVFERDKVPMR